MNSPVSDIRISALGKDSKLNSQSIAAVKMLGSKEKLNWKQEADALVIKKPLGLPQWKVVTFEIEFKK